MGIDGSTKLANCAMAFPRVFPNVDQAPMLGPIVGTGEVDDKSLALDGDGDMHVNVPIALWVGVDVHVGFVGAVGPFTDLLREAPMGVVDRVIDGSE